MTTISFGSMAKFFLVGSAICVFLFYVLFTRSDQETHSIFYIRGENLHEIVKKDGSFKSVLAFLAIEKIAKIKTRIVTGEYEIQKGDTVFELIEKMLSGKRVVRKITIPEGYTVKMILEIVRDNPLLFGDIEEPIQEASLAPNTYFYYFGDSKESVLKQMKNQMEKITQKLAPKNKTNLTFREILILASIIEKETGNESERSLISSVFHNRLAIKMMLQSDPTVIYAVSDKYGKMNRSLTRKDLQFDSPYNTYQCHGLPPAPICCPGEKSIVAAMQPKKTDFLYFVASPDLQGHVFAKEYNTHIAHVSNLRKHKKAQSSSR